MKEERSGRRGKRNAPLRDAHGAVVPRRGVEEHAVVMEGRGFVNAVRRMDNERVIGRNVDWRGSGRRVLSMLKQARKTKCLRPGAVDTNDPTGR